MTTEVSVFRADDYLNFLNLEHALSSLHKTTLKSRRLHLELSDLKWVSPLSICILFSWAKEILDANGEVILSPPTSDSFATRFFYSSGVTSIFESIGARISRSHGKPPALRKRTAAAFQYFSSSEVAEDYIKALGDRPRAQLLLHADDLPEIASSGDLSRTVLKELADNAFTHGTSQSCHCAVLEASPADQPRGEHPLFSPLGNRAYVEICVADSSNVNLVDTLLPFVPPNYRPRGRGLEDHGWTDTERCLFYAFEYDSTSKPERRRQRIIDLLREEEAAVQSITTGLYDVAAVARFYRGQIIFRVGAHAGAIDFSRGYKEPKLVLQGKVGRRSLVTVRGSLILLRVPTEIVGKEQVVVPPLSLSTRRESPNILSIGIVPAADFKTFDEEIDTALFIEREVIAATRRPPAREVLSGEKKVELLTVMLDGIDLSSKALGALLLVLMRIPRHSLRLLLIVDDSVKVALAREQWERLQQLLGGKFDFLRYPSFVLAAEGTSAVTGFGSSQHPEATTNAGETLKLTYVGLEFSLSDVLTEVRRLRLAEAALREPICQTGELYLVESAYYTPLFFEVRKLLDTVPERRTLTLWLASKLRILKPKVIVVSTDFLRDLVEELVGPWVAGKGTKVLHVESTNIIALALRTATGAAEKLLVVLDVLCTGRFLHRFLELVPEPRHIGVIAIVDARPGDAPFIPVSREHGTVDVPVFSIVRRPIQVLRDRPDDVDFRKVVIVDALTHSPTRYALPERSPLEANVLLERAELVGGLTAGHFYFKERHYTYFFSLKPTFRAIRRELEEWLSDCAQELLVEIGVRPQGVTVYCLDEGTGLLEVVESILAGRGVPRPIAISRKELVAPPTRPGVNVDAVWFVLSAMATGATARRTLEYGRAIGAKKIFLSIVAARMEADRVLFYQNVTRYRNAEVKVRFLCSLPLVAYSEASCPVCGLRESFENLLVKVGPTRPALRKLVEERVRGLSPVPARSAALVGLEPPGSSYRGLWLEARARQEFETADRDQEARRRLRRWLEGQEEAEALAAAVGREPRARVFSVERLKVIAYAPEVIAAACSNWCRHPTHDGRLFERQLRGFSHLSRESLRPELPALFRRYREHPDLLSSLIVEAARDPELYEEALSLVEKPAEPALVQALHETEEYITRGASGEQATAVLALHELRWHLTRSAGFGMPIEILRMKLSQHPQNEEEIRAAYDRFVQDGFSEAQRRLHIFRKAGLVSDRLKNAHIDLDLEWREVASAVAYLGDRLAEGLEEYSILMKAIQSLEEATRHYVELIDYIAIQAGPRMSQIKELAQVSDKTNIAFRVFVDESCPAIAMCSEDFEEVILLLLENAKRWQANGEGAESIFRFEPVPETSFVRLRVVQSYPWTLTRKLEGGLARIRELLSYYGGSVSMEREAAPGNPFMTIRLFAWPLEKREKQI